MTGKIEPLLGIVAVTSDPSRRPRVQPVMNAAAQPQTKPENAALAAEVPRRGGRAREGCRLQLSLDDGRATDGRVRPWQRRSARMPA